MKQFAKSLPDAIYFVWQKHLYISKSERLANHFDFHKIRDAGVVIKY